MANELANKIFELVKKGKREEAENLIREAVEIKPKKAKLTVTEIAKETAYNLLFFFINSIKLLPFPLFSSSL